MPTLHHYDPVPSDVATALAAYPPTVQTLLVNRGITTADAAARFLEPSYDEHLHDPFLLPGMEAAVDRLVTAVAESQMIVVYSDYDCDGIPGAVVLHDCLRAIGHDRFVNVIPHRHYDGFGLSEGAVERIVAEHVPHLIITIDCGTSDAPAVAAANAAGVDVIVTDHHEPPETLPNAVAIVNPKLGDSYPFSGLCGAAVVYKLAQAVLARGDFAVPPGREKWWLDMVGVATIADMVPLTGENRVLAHYGLHVLRKSRRPGLQQLLRKQRADQRRLTEDDIGFTIGPRINAASRMDTPEDAFQLLATTDESEAGTYVTHLEKLNTARKSAVATMTKDLHKRVAVTTELPPVLVYGNPEWRPSLVGLAANKLAEEHNRPVFLWGRDGNEVLKGSCRSDGTVSVVRLMETAADAFTEYGGHHFSGGFSVTETAIHTLSDALNAAHATLGADAAVEQSYAIDATLALVDVNQALLTALRQCAPYGMDNPKPLFLFPDVSLTDVSQFGKGGEHCKLTLPAAGAATEAIAFFATPEQYSVLPTTERPVSLVAHVEESYFMGRHQVRLRLVDVVAA